MWKDRCVFCILQADGMCVCIGQGTGVCVPVLNIANQ